MKRLPDRIAALEAMAPPAVEHDLSDVPTHILEKLAVADLNAPLGAVLDADELELFEATVKCR